MNREITLIGVAGAGSMGAGIAQLAAMAGFRVRLYARRAAALADAAGRIETSLAKLHEKGLIGEEPTVSAPESAIVMSLLLCLTVIW